MAEKELKSLQFGVSGDVYKVHDVTARANIEELDAKVDQAVENLEGDIAEAVDGLASEQYVDGAIGDAKTEIAEDIANAVGDAKTEIAEDIADAISDTKTEIASDIADAVAGLASETYVGEAIADAKTEIAGDISDAVAGLASETYVDNGLATKQNTIDADHKLAVNLVDGAATESALEELADVVDTNEENYQQDKEQYIVRTTHHVSTNLFKSDYLVDGKLISYDERSSFLTKFANGIVTKVPVEEGKTYTLRVKDGNNHNLHVGAVCFGNNNTDSAGVFGVNATSLTSYGSNTGSTQYDGWPIDSNLVTISYNSSQASNTFTIHEGSGIKWLYFYIRKYDDSSNYYGAHSDLSVLANYQIQLNEGSALLPYEEYYEPYDTETRLYQEYTDGLVGPIDDRLEAVENVIEDTDLANHLDDIDNIIDEFVVNNRISNNLYDKSLMMDHKLINNGGGLGNYNDSIISGWVPVEEGKTYTVVGGKEGNRWHVGAICFVKEDKSRVCGANATSLTAYGGGTAYWPALTGFVNASYNANNRSNTFTVLEGSGIKYLVFYVNRIGNSSNNYYGTHSDLSVVADYQVQMNEGTEVLPYEEYNVQINKARYEEADEQIQLDLNQQMEDFRADMEDEVGSLVGNPKLKLTMSNNGNTWQIESILKDQLCGEHQVKSIGTVTANRTNHLFEFENTYIDGQQIKGASDDITPMNGGCSGRWAGTYIGANHGQSNGYTLTFAEPHGKTNDDIGSVWAKGSTQYVIYEVPSTTTVRVVNALSTPGTGGGTMTHVSGATHTEDMVYTSASMDQMYRAANKVTIHVYDENWKEIPVNKNGVYKSNKFRFVQSYDILCPDKAIQHIREMKAEGQSVTRDNLHDDGIQAFVRQNICYEYSEGNACTVYMRSDFLDTFTGFHGVVQSGAISGTPTASSPEYCYVAGWNNNTPYENYGAGTTPSTDFPKSQWDDQSNPPYRYYQFGYGAKRPMGMMQGYYTKIGVGVPSVRTQVLGNSAGFCYTSGKMYPYAYSGKTLHAGDVRETVAFYSPLIMDMDNDNCFASVYNYVYDDIILAIDYQEAADVLYRLRPECVGKQIEVLDKTDNVTMDRTMASSEKLPITFEGKGWIVLRFYKDADESDNNPLTEEDLYTKIKTVNGNSLIGSGDLLIEAAGVPELRADFEALNTQYQADRDDFLVNTHTTTNLFKRDYLLDHTILNFDPNNAFATYAAGILAKVPVEEGKTYTVGNQCTGTNIHLGAICFTNSADKGVFGVSATNPTYAYGYHTTGKPDWPVDNTKVTISYNSSNKTNTFTVLEGSDIKYVWFYIRKKNNDSTNYWGTHDDLSVVTDDYHIQVNEGDTLLPYEPYYEDWYSAKWEDADEELEASIPTIVDSAVDTATASINAEIDDINDNIDAYVRSYKPSTNLFKREYLVDQKLISYSHAGSFLPNFANGIVAKAPVEEGKTYTIHIANGSNTSLSAGAVCFGPSAESNGIFGVNATSLTSYGAGISSQYTGWPTDSNLVSISYNSTNKSNTFTVKEGSGIRYVYFFIKRVDNDNYYGAHTDLSVLDNYKIQMNEGTEVLPYEDESPKPYGLAIPKETNITVADSTATDVATLVSNFNTLLQALRDRDILADS